MENIMNELPFPPTRTTKSHFPVIPLWCSGWLSLPQALVALACVAATSLPAHAQGVPVIAPAELAQQTLMVQNLIQQVKNQEAQYQALTNNHGFGQILNNPSLRSYLPEQWQSVYDQSKSGGLGGISTSMRNIEDQEGTTQASTPAQQRYNDTLATNKAMTMQAYQSNLDRLNNIQGLMQQSNQTQDPSAKADLQNRLLAEQAMVQNEQTRLNLMSQLQQQETKMADEQREREFRNAFIGASNGQ
jgi:type IV secretion system protein VirB5